LLATVAVQVDGVACLAVLKRQLQFLRHYAKVPFSYRVAADSDLVRCLTLIRAEGEVQADQKGRRGVF
jgi:hypothetical protein